MYVSGKDKFMIVKRYTSNITSGNLYLLIENDEYIIIDPCVSYQSIKKEVYNKKCCGIIITHGHFDHFNCLKSYLELDIIIYLHKEAYFKLDDNIKNGSAYFNIDFNIDIDKFKFEYVYDMEKLNLMNNEFLIIYTPGHTSCSICIEVLDYLFTGDTLFKTSVGRTDLYSGNSKKLIDSLKKIINLKKNYIVFPGHDEETTLEDEKKYNEYINYRIEE